MKKVKIDDISKEIQKELSLYHQDINDKVKKSAQKNIREMAKETKQQKYKNKGTKYINAIATTKLEESLNAITMAWYVKPPHYRLSHLLEWGHATANGGRTIAYGTITKAEKNAVDNYLKEVEAIISGA